MTRAGIALGSNLGNRLAALTEARKRLEKLENVQPPVLASSIYETDPVDCEADAPKFLNAVIELSFDGTAVELLQSLRQIEAALGRSPEHAKNISRTLDLDLLYFGNVTSTSADLQLPHPRMHERRFVLEPLNDIRPDLVLPNQTETVAELLQRLAETRSLARATSEW